MADYASIQAERMKRAKEHVESRKSLGADGTAWDVCRNFAIRFDAAEKMVLSERLRRGEITIADLTQAQRRELIDPAKLDLHAIAAGPIMDSNQIYLPAGKISLAEAKAREAQTVLSVDYPHP